MVDRCLTLLTELGIARCTLFVVADNEDGAAYWKHTGWRERVDLKAVSASSVSFLSALLLFDIRHRRLARSREAALPAFVFGLLVFFRVL